MTVCAEKPKGKRPKGLIGWMVTNVGGVLYSYYRHNAPTRVKNLFPGGRYGKRRKVPNLVGSGCGDKQRYFFSAVRNGDKSLTLFIQDTAMIVDVNFHIADGEICVIQQEGPFCFVKRPVENYPKQKPAPQQMPLVMVLPKPQPSVRYFFWVEKRTPSPLMYPPRCAVEFYNDGVHLYVKQNGLQHQLLFRMFKREVLTVFVHGMVFRDYVVFKTHGHTLSGGVVISLREVSNKWTVTLSIPPRHTIAVDEMSDRVGVRRIVR